MLWQIGRFCTDGKYLVSVLLSAVLVYSIKYIHLGYTLLEWVEVLKLSLVRYTEVVVVLECHFH